MSMTRVLCTQKEIGISCCRVAFLQHKLCSTTMARGAASALTAKYRQPPKCGCSAAQSDSNQSMSGGFNNLGALNRVAQQASVEDPALWQRVDRESLRGKELNVDGSAIFGTLVFALVLLGFTFERVLGLDKVFANWIRDQRDKKANKQRDEVFDARRSLEDRWQDPPDESSTRGGGGSPRSDRGPPG